MRVFLTIKQIYSVLANNCLKGLILKAGGSAIPSLGEER
jgi:hypothetical protein